MKFWIENNVEISYSQLLDDLQKKDTNVKQNGYRYFLLLLKDLCQDCVLNSIDDLITHIVNNKNHLSFHINTSGTTSSPKPVEIKMSNCIRHVKTKDLSLIHI